MLAGLPTRLYVVFGAGLAARLVAGALSGGAFDYWKHRLPTARCLDAGGTLYCDCVCNHTPLYPYLSAAMFHVSPDIAWVRALLLTLPAALGDALVPIALFSLLRRLGREHLGFAAAALYAFNPISVYEIRLAHWDGLTVLTVLLGLSALTAGRAIKAGVAVGIGALLKQFPLALLPIAALKERSARELATTTLAAGAIVTLGFLPFLLGCPRTMLESLASHPLWNGEAPRGVGVGTVQQVFSELGVPYAKLVWFAGFLALLAPAVLRARRSSHFELTGLVLVVLAYFTYATHRQLVVWALPFLIVFSLERRTFWPLALVVAGYAIRVVKPAWYFGLVHLFAGAWYYAAMLDAGSRSFRRRPALRELPLARSVASERR